MKGAELKGMGVSRQRNFVDPGNKDEIHFSSSIYYNASNE
jgi:hypothetical protein